MAVDTFLSTPQGEAFAEQHPEALRMEGAPNREKLSKGKKIEGLIREAADVVTIQQEGRSLNLRRRREVQREIAIENLYHQRAMQKIKLSGEGRYAPAKLAALEAKRRKKRDQISRRRGNQSAVTLTVTLILILILIPILILKE